jgi:hypothetical protein
MKSFFKRKFLPLNHARPYPKYAELFGIINSVAALTQNLADFRECEGGSLLERKFPNILRKRGIDFSEWWEISSKGDLFP